MSKTTFYSKELLNNFRKAICYTYDFENSNRFKEIEKQKDAIDPEEYNDLMTEFFIDDLASEMGWNLCYLNIDVFQKAFSTLTIKNDFKIYIFIWRDDIGGYGIPYCLPISVSATDVFSEWIVKNKPHQISAYTKPINAIDNFMEAVNGDGSPLSYISASIFRREVEELGAFWHGILWGSHEYIEKDDDIKNLKGIVWNEPKPKDWRPVVYEDNKKIIVTFYTYSEFGRVQIFRHQDTYEVGNYVFSTKTKTIAKGEEGYIY